MEESTSPFIDDGDGFTRERERERIRSLLSLATYAGGYKMLVDAYNTVDITVGCQMHVGGRVVFFGYGRRRRLPHYWYLETRRGVYHVRPVR